MMPYKVLQLTDCHLFDSHKGELFGVNTYQALKKVLSFIQANTLSFDLIILTGDLSQDGSAASYKTLAELLSPLQKEIYWIAGNHDNPQIMASVFANYPLFKQTKYLKLDKWDFLFVDTVLAGQDFGYISEQEITLFKENLKASNQSSSLALFMHHHPAKVNTPLVDDYILKNNETFWQTLAESSRKIDMVICGHVHGAYDLSINNTRLITAPATCLQWKKGTSALALEKQSGFTLWNFSRDGALSYQTYLI